LNPLSEDTLTTNYNELMNSKSRITKVEVTIQKLNQEDLSIEH